MSIRTASRLIARIKHMDPEVLATDCLSCRIQFHQLTPYNVLHPIQIIKQSYDNFKGVIEDKAAEKLDAPDKFFKRINGRPE